MPMQSGHAPYGALNEKSRGLNSSTEKPCSGQARASENTSSLSISRFLPKNCTITVPSERVVAVSMASASLEVTPSFITMRSVITSMLCLKFFFSSILSASSLISPSIRTRVKPCARKPSRSLTCSPLRPETTGAKTTMRLEDFLVDAMFALLVSSVTSPEPAPPAPATPSAPTSSPAPAAPSAPATPAAPPALRLKTTSTT